MIYQVWSSSMPWKRLIHWKKLQEEIFKKQMSCHERDIGCSNKRVLPDFARSEILQIKTTEALFLWSLLLWCVPVSLSLGAPAPLSPASGMQATSANILLLGEICSSISMKSIPQLLQLFTQVVFSGQSTAAAQSSRSHKSSAPVAFAQEAFVPQAQLLVLTNPSPWQHAALNWYHELCELVTYSQD